MRFPVIILALLSLLYRLAEPGTMAPTQTLVNPHYFGSHYIKLVSAVEPGSPTFGGVSRQFKRPLGKTYSNIKHINVILSSFRCQSNNYFGFDLSVSSAVDPTTEVNITFKQMTLSSFSSIGVSVLIITSPFDQVMTILDFDLDAEYYDYPKVFQIPTSKDQYAFIKSLHLYSTAQVYMSLTMTFVAPNTVNLKYNSDTDDSTIVSGTPFDVTCQAIVIIMNKITKPNIVQFNFLSWSGQSIEDPFSYNDFNIPNGTYGTDLDRRCILGFHRLDDIHYNKGAFDFDLDPVNGVINPYQIRVNVYNDYQWVCFKDLKCPTTHLYKKLNDFANCWDCQGGVVATNGIANCVVYDSTFEKIEFDELTGNVNSKCLKCNDCENHYLVDNSDCKLCNTVFPNCVICNEKVACLSCVITHAVNATGYCQPCGQYITNCAECMTNSTCQKCDNDFYLDTNQCLQCKKDIPYCTKCLSSNHCTQCQYPFQLDFEGAGNKCICKKGWEVTDTCNQIIGCISSHIVDNITKCYACDTSQNFVYVRPHNCTCRKGFYFNTKDSKCKSKCGDGIKIKTQDCDDGNMESGEGCSAGCTVEENFDCSKIRYQQSVCKYNLNIGAQVYSLAREYGSSSLKLKIQLSQSHPFIKTNDWPQMVSVNSTKINFVSHSFEGNDILVLQYGISESIEGQTLNWKISFNQSKFSSSPTQLNILMKGMNAPLTYEQYYFQQKIIYIVSYCLGGCAFVIAIVAMIKAQSNIAFELVTTILFIFYSRIISFDKNSAILYTLGGLRVAAGYNEFFLDDHRDYVQFVSKNRFFIKSQLGLGILFSLALVTILLLIKFIIQVKSIFGVISSQKLQAKEDVEHSKKERIFSRVLKMSFMSLATFQKKFLTPITLICFYQIFASYNGQQNAGKRFQPYFSKLVTNLILLFFFLVLLYYLIFASSLIRKILQITQPVRPRKKKNDKKLNLSFKEQSNFYIQTFTFYMLSTSVLILFTLDFSREQYNFNHIIETTFGVVLLYLIVIIFIKPYKDGLSTFAIIFHQIVKMVFLAFLFLLKKDLLSQFLQLIGVYVTLLLILATIVISIIRIKKTWKVAKTQEQQLKELMENQSKKRQKNEEEIAKKKKKKKYQKDDPENNFRYENIYQKEKERRAKQLGFNFDNFIQQSKKEIVPSIMDIICFQDQEKNLKQGLISKETPQNMRQAGKQSIDSKNSLQLRKIKQSLRKQCVELKKNKKFSGQNKMSPLEQYEDELEKKYDYELWKEKNPERAKKQEQLRKKKKNSNGLKF